MKKSQYLGLSWQIIVLSAATLVGLIGLAYFPTPLKHKELIFVSMVLQLFNPLAAGIVLSAIVSATLSAVNAQVLIVSSVFTQDVYSRRFAISPSATKLLHVYRASIIALCFIAVLLTLTVRTTIQTLVQYAWMGLGSSLGPLVIVSLYKDSITKEAALWGMAGGCLIAGCWGLLAPSVQQWSGLAIPALIPGFLVNIIILYVLSAGQTETSGFTKQI
jgi:sodium/proline symporter